MRRRRRRRRRREGPTADLADEVDAFLVVKGLEDFVAGGGEERPMAA